jgi:malonyl-CoA/methylmalonyl-CoA synthetase
LVRSLRAAFARDPDGAALTLWPSPGAQPAAPTTLTWRALDTLADRAVGVLRSLGVPPGAVVAGLLPRAPEQLALFLGCLRHGCAWMPINARATARELEAQARDAGASRVWVPAAMADAVAALGDAVCLAEDLPALLARTPPSAGPDPLADAPALACATSGTTGRPKIALLSHGNLFATVEALHDAWAWRPDDRLVHALPLDHIHGLVVAQLVACRAGAEAVWMPHFDADEVFRAVRETRATVLMGVPTFYHRFMALPAERASDLRSLRLATCGSAPLPAPLLEAFAERFGVRILERYGMSEVGIVLSNPWIGARVAGAVGSPLPGVRARVVDADGADVPDGVPGELLLSGPSVFDGYLRLVDGAPTRDRSCFVAGPDGASWMRTGDAVTREDGVYRVVGRLKEMIITGGSNVYPAEVEAVLAEHPGVAEVAVFGVPDDDLGERPVAAVVPRGGGVTGAELVAWARARLAPYKVPRAVTLRDALPRNAMGKLVKGELVASWGRVVARRACRADHATLVAWNVAMAAETESIDLDVDVVSRGVAAALEDPARGTYWLAERAGRVVGQLMVTPEWSDWRAAWVHWIQSVYVPPEARGQGVYRALATAVADAARAHGAAGLRLYVDQRNTSAMAVYARLGMNGDHYRVFELMFDGDGA